MNQRIHTVEDIQQQYRWLQHMREKHPIWLDEESGCWHVFRYKDVSHVMAEAQPLVLSVGYTPIAVCVAAAGGRR